MREPVKLRVVVVDKYHTEHSGEIELAPHETDEAFFERAKAMLAELREELP